MKVFNPLSVFTSLLLFSQTNLGLVEAQRSSVNLGSKVIDNNKSPTSSKGKSSSFFASASEPDLTGLDADTDSKDDIEILEERDDPSYESCEVGFEGIRILLKQKKKKSDRVILDGSLKGKARPGRMLAVMGPSGSGKSSLVHALAGRIKDSKFITVEGKRYINDQPLSGDSSLPAALIEQDVNFFPHMTVKETLDFRVELKLGSKLGKSARDDVVSELMDMLGLTKSAHTIVGNSKVRGLSGGERKRLSIACELISSPPVMILDEPTSGLDSYQATQVVDFMKKLAESGKTVIAVIHQPSQSVFSKFDDLLLLSEGRLMYYGEVSKVRSYMHGIGYPCDKDTGTAEYVLDCISRSNGGPEEQAESDARLDRIAAAALTSTTGIVFDSSNGSVVRHQHHHKFKIGNKRNLPGANILRQFKLLLGRSFNETIRGKLAIFIKVMQQITLGVVYGGIYKVGNDQASVMDRFGLLSLIVVGGLNMSLASTIRSFAKEKSIVSSEMAGGMYRTLPYFLAKAISEIPLAGLYSILFGAIIYPSANLQKGRFNQFIGLSTLTTLAGEGMGLIVGALAPNSEAALALFPPIVVLNIIFDGRNLSEENTPKFLKLLPKVSLVRWGFEGLAVNEFEGLEFDTSGPRRGPVVRTGRDALAKFGFADRTLPEVVGALRNIIVSCWMFSYLALSLNKSKFETMMS